MKKELTLSIIVIIALSAMIVRINDKGYMPFNTEQHLAYTAYTDNLNEEEKADIGLMGVTSLTNLVNTITTTFDYAKKVVKTITDFLNRNDRTDWWPIPRTWPGWNPGTQ